MASPSTSKWNKILYGFQPVRRVNFESSHFFVQLTWHLGHLVGIIKPLLPHWT